MALLEVDRLSVALPAGAERSHAVDGVSFDVAAGEIVCLVGESGSGKTVIAQSVMGLLPPELRPSGGSMLLDGENLLAAGETRLRELMLADSRVYAFHMPGQCGAPLRATALREHPLLPGLRAGTSMPGMRDSATLIEI